MKYKKWFLDGCMALLAIFLLPTAAISHTAKYKQAILQTLQQANQHFMNKWPDPGAVVTVKGVSRPSNLWTRAVYYEGLMALYSIYGEKVYYDYSVRWGNSHQWGLRSGATTRDADHQCAGQTYIDLFEISKNELWVSAIKASIDSMVASDKVDDWYWIDALQMAMPVFVKLGKHYNDSRYYEKMYKLYAYTKYKQGGTGLYNPVDKLWWRDKDFIPPYKEPNGSNCYWSRGNGWVLAALVRTLQDLTVSDPHYQEYLDDYKNMCAALLPLQRKDGYWNVSLTDSSHFGGKELTGTALFVYGYAWGINNRMLPRAKYLPSVTNAWNAMQREAVRKDGSLAYVQGTGKEPKDGQPVNYTSVPDFEDYGLGCFLLAGVEVYKLKK
ncbi:MAG: glycoside hydrolase family 88 protein [Flavipsychrobacter sp.]|nr:glycoside hydrolase family 88 protein [Flavipsychrobacter sp.]